MTIPSQQNMSTPCFLSLPDWSLTLCSTGGKFLLLHGFLLLPDHFFSLHSTGCECLCWLASFNFTIPTSPSLHAQQEVSSHHLLSFFCLPDQSLALNSTGCEYTSLADFLLLSQLVPHFVLNRRWVPLTYLLSFTFLTQPLLKTQQDTVPTGPLLHAQPEVSSPHLLIFFCLPDQFFSLCSTGHECPSLAGFFRCPDWSIALHSTGGEFPSLACFLLLSWPSPCSKLNRMLSWPVPHSALNQRWVS
jgi:hypothetical protein